MPRVRRGVLAWAAVVAAAAALLAASGYTSRDPDSTAYSIIGARLAREPLSTWLVPQWWGAWDLEGPFREHPVGILVVPALLARLGYPAEQAAYAVGAAMSALAIVLVGDVAARIVRPHEVAAVRWAALLLPVAFVYRIRANQEYPVLVLMLLALLATDRARQRAVWIAGMAAAAVGLFLVKGIFVVFMPIVCALWLLLVPAAASERNRQAWAGIGVSLLVVAITVVLYEWAYRAVAGDSFFEYYIATRLGSNTGLDQGRMPDLMEKVPNLGWYAVRLAWFAVPGSLALVAAAAGGGWRQWRASPGLSFAVATGAAYVAVMSLGSNRADRFIFPAYFAIGVAGAVVAMRRWAPIERAARWIDRQQPIGKPIAWFVLFLLTFITGRGLPRIQL